MKSYEIVTVATHYEGMLESLVHNKYNEEIKILGMGQKWTGFKMKYDLIYDHIENLPDDMIIIFLDGFDSEIVGHVDKAIERFKQQHYKVLFSVEVYTNGFGSEAIIFPKCNNNKYFANTGLYMGYVKELKQVLKACIQETCKDDQVILNNLCKTFPFIGVDDKEVIFQNIKHPIFSFGQQKYNDKAIFIGYPGYPTFNRNIRFFIEYGQFVLPFIFLFYLLCLWLIYKYANKKNQPILFILTSILLFIWLYNMDYSCVKCHTFYSPWIYDNGKC